jgi:hypothetical protein
MADHKAFLVRNVEGYLFDDLRAMQALVAPVGATGGGAGYPLLMSAFAGIELFGALVSTAAFHANSGKVYFRHFWSRYLYPSLNNASEIGQSLYQLVRHGVAHGFVVKGSIAVLKRTPAKHLKRDAQDLICIDAVQLADDLIECYFATLKPMATSTTGPVSEATIAARLSEMEQAYATQAAQLRASRYFGLAGGPPTAPVTQSLGVQGAAGSQPLESTAPGGPTGPTFS